MAQDRTKTHGWQDKAGQAGKQAENKATANRGKMRKKKEKTDKRMMAGFMLLFLMIGLVIGSTIQKRADSKTMPKMEFNDYLNRTVIKQGDKTFVQIKIWELECLKNTEVPDEWKKKLAM